MASIACISKMRDFLSNLPRFLEVKCLEHLILMFFLWSAFYVFEKFHLITHLLQNASEEGRHGGPGVLNVLAKDIQLDGGRDKTGRGKWNKKRNINYGLCL